MMKYRGQRVFDNRWVYGNLIVDNQGVSYIIPFKNISFKKDVLKVSNPDLIKQKTIGQRVFEKDEKEYYQDDIIQVDVKDGDSFVGRLEYNNGAWGIWNIFDKGLHLTSLFSDEVITLTKVGNYHTHREKWMKGWED